MRGQDEFRVRIVGTDTHGGNRIAGSSFCDAFYTVSPAGDPGYLAELLRICEREGVDLLVPIVDPELPVIAEHAALFADIGTEAVVAKSETVRTCNDKLATCRRLAEGGVPVPESRAADEVAAPGELPYPVFVKPRGGVSSRDAFRVDTPEEFARARVRVPDLVVQELLAGEEYTTDVFCGPDGRVVAVVPRRRVQTRAGISYKGVTCHDERLIRWGVRICEVLDLRGPANIQCMVDGDDVRYFEVNPRFSGSLPLTIAAGVNTPLWMLKLWDGQPAPDDLLPFEEVFMTRYWAEIFHPVEEPVPVS